MLNNLIGMLKMEGYKHNLLTLCQVDVEFETHNIRIILMDNYYQTYAYNKEQLLSKNTFNTVNEIKPYLKEQQ